MGPRIEWNQFDLTGGGHRSEPGWRTIAAVIILPCIVTFSLVLLFAQPLVSTSFDETLHPSGVYPCYGVYCPETPAGFVVGNGNYATARGSWHTVFSGEAEVLVYDGPYSSLCQIGDVNQCSALLYASGTQYPRSDSGSFDVGGTGPFNIVAISLLGSPNTTIEGTVDSVLF
jgi:hypothetical protein